MERFSSFLRKLKGEFADALNLLIPVCIIVLIVLVVVGEVAFPNLNLTQYFVLK
jgi:hypothetical protein